MYSTACNSLSLRFGLYGDVDLENLISVSIGRMACQGTIDSEIAEWRL